jgi:hypothetical protein
LALAAEDRLPDGDGPYLFKKLKEYLSKEQIDRLNDVRNWLKHDRLPDNMDLYEFEVITCLMRAISRFAAAYREISPAMRGFDEQLQARGYRTSKPLV